MLFNSIEFLIFFCIVFVVYWFALKKSYTKQNIFILVASYIFYGWWDWRFLFLISLSTVTDYTIGIFMSQSTTQKSKKRFLWLSLMVNLGLLAIFKYYNFFVDNFVEAFGLLGIELNARTLSIILPVGISFYTFQTLSYTIDIYRGRIEPTKNFIAFATFISFFPQLVAGPIERATNLLPQFLKERNFTTNNAIDGLRQIIWGLFKKVVIADNCGVFVDDIFTNYADYSGGVVFLGAILFAFQLYGDFSGYSDIAIGVARILGFNLLQNFKFPYFTSNMSDFWGRWHISLSTWTNDYIFLPLNTALSKVSKKSIYTSLIITFLILGLWHGANWTYVVFGLIHGLTVAFEFLTRKQRNISKKKYSKIFSLGGWAITMFIWLLSLIFFRALSVDHAWGIISSVQLSNLFDFSSFSFSTDLIIVLVFIALLLAVEWKSRFYEHTLEKLELRLGPIPRRLTYYFLVFVILGFKGSEQNFIYFQF